MDRLSGERISGAGRFDVRVRGMAGGDRRSRRRGARAAIDQSQDFCNWLRYFWKFPERARNLSIEHQEAIRCAPREDCCEDM